MTFIIIMPYRTTPALRLGTLHLHYYPKQFAKQTFCRFRAINDVVVVVVVYQRVISQGEGGKEGERKEGR